MEVSTSDYSYKMTVCLSNVTQNCLYCHIFYKKADSILYYKYADYLCTYYMSKT